MTWMGGTRYFNALSQEKTGDFWVNGRMFGVADLPHVRGRRGVRPAGRARCNPWLAHGFTGARHVLNEIKNDPARKMIVIDPRRTETAQVADLHLPLRPGTDAYLLAALLAMVLERGGQDARFLAARTEGFAEVAAALAPRARRRLDRARRGGARRRRARRRHDPRGRRR